MLDIVLAILFALSYNIAVTNFIKVAEANKQIKEIKQWQRNQKR